MRRCLQPDEVHLDVVEVEQIAEVRLGAGAGRLEAQVEAPVAADHTPQITGQVQLELGVEAVRDRDDLLGVDAVGVDDAGAEVGTQAGRGGQADLDDVVGELRQRRVGVDGDAGLAGGLGGGGRTVVWGVSVMVIGGSFPRTTGHCVRRNDSHDPPRRLARGAARLMVGLEPNETSAQVEMNVAQTRMNYRQLSTSSVGSRGPASRIRPAGIQPRSTRPASAPWCSPSRMNTAPLTTVRS